MITEETRFESYLATNPETIQKKILAILSEPMTARQIVNKLGYSHPIVVRPRITELMHTGEIEAAGKVFDEITARNVAVFRKVENQ